MRTNPPAIPVHNALAWSECRIDAGVDRPAIALWRQPDDAPAVAVGLSQSIDREVDREACRQDGVRLVRRASGGGAVWLGTGVLCWEAFRPAPPPGAPPRIREDYIDLSRPVLLACQRLGARVVRAGICDLAVAGAEGGPARKIAGMAQLRRRGGVLVHGSLLVDADLSALSRYLPMPSDMPEYRAGRGHGSFCVTLSAAVGRRLTVHEVAEAVEGVLTETSSSAAADLGGPWIMETIPSTPPPEVADRVRDKYTDAGWTESRRPNRG